MSWWARDARKEARRVLRLARSGDENVGAIDLKVIYFPDDPFWFDWPAVDYIADESFMSVNVSLDAADYLVACGAEKIIHEGELP